MPTFDECCVLIPSATLEDFPAKASDSEACSMLAAWTVLWHPQLLLQTEQTPTWYRADSPPDPTIPRLVTVPTLSVEMLPDRYEIRCRQLEGSRWVTGATRQEMLDSLDLGQDPPRLQGKHRSIGVDDFFAAGFTLLQIQVMTRRLRYTSNLDEIHLQNRAIAAAKAFQEGNADEAIDALHGFYDSLAEERDHYFASDPHLIDLTLLTPSTLPGLLESCDLSERPADDETESSRLPTPQNVLIDADSADAIGHDASRFANLRQALASGQLGWAGGGPASAVSLDTMTLAQAQQAIDQAFERTKQSLGGSPAVFARYAGTTPADLTAQLVRNGYLGMISIDFADGTGFGDEAKVIRSFGGAQIEALTAKPIDAASDAAFLDLGPRLGEAIDSGEVATGLLAHWPGRVSQSFHDLKCAASWTLALGRFWKVDDYFRDGEHPYHHDTARAANGDSARRLEDVVREGQSDPISRATESFREAIAAEARQRIGAMTAIISGSIRQADAAADDQETLFRSFASASGAVVEPKGDAAMIVNPQDVASRQTVAITGNVPETGDHIYASTPNPDQTHPAAMDVTVDTPALGFAVVSGDSKPAAGGKGSLLRKLFGKNKCIAEENSLQNEFMEIAVSPKTGGIQGVYSGATRGNRFSLRIAVESSDKNDDAESRVMICEKIRIVDSTPAVGTIETSGRVNDATGKTLCKFVLRYRLCRGSRMVNVSGTLSDVAELTGSPWRNYIALRAAVSTESAIHRVLLRDKVHRCSGRRLVAPLGVVIDEAERQTLVASGGMPFHRRVGNQFLDTLLLVRGESKHQFELQYGFDVPSPVPVATSVIAPASDFPIADSASLPPRGWIMHSSPKEVMISDLRVSERADGQLAVLVRLVQTRSKSATATIRFCRDVSFAVPVDLSTDEVQWDVAPPRNDRDDEQDESARDPSDYSTEGESVRVPLVGHQVADVLVVLDKKT